MGRRRIAASASPQPVARPTPDVPGAGRAPHPTPRSYEQVASTQLIPEPQSLPSLHCGEASPGVSQKPPAPQTVAAVQVQQSASERQLARQKPSTQLMPPLQSAFERQLACGRVSGSHSPSSHISCGPHCASLVQAPWQNPFTQVSSAGQSLFKTQAPPPAVLGWQNPPAHMSPIPQSAAELHPGWQAPFVQRAPTPHSLLN